MAGRVVVNHLGHCVTDLALARRFYEELLGFDYWRELTPPQKESAKLLGLTEPLESTICYLRRDGFVLELIYYGASDHRPTPKRRAMDEPGLTHISLSCDVADVCARVADYGGEVLTDTDIGVAVFVRDPDGQLVELLPLEYADRVSSL
jgi:catechol 2,3-dioxygenase-like lactoylglutathione lyase family enzyme